MDFHGQSSGFAKLPLVYCIITLQLKIYEMMVTSEFKQIVNCPLEEQLRKLDININQ